MLKLNKKIVTFTTLLFSCSLSFPLFLGDGTDENIYHPIKLIDSGVEKILVKSDATYVVKNDRSLWGTGRIGVRTENLNDKKRRNFLYISTNRFEKIADNAVDGNFGIILKRDGKLVLKTKNDYCLAENVQKLCYVSFGDDFCIKKEKKEFYLTYYFTFIKTDGTLWLGTFPEKSASPVLTKIADDIIDCYKFGEFLLNKKHELFKEKEPQNKTYPTDFINLEGKEYYRIAKKVKCFSNYYAFVTTKGDLFVPSYYSSKFMKKESAKNTKKIVHEKIMGNVSDCWTSDWSMLILTNDGKLYGMAAFPDYAECIGIKIENNEFFKPYFIADNVKDCMFSGDWYGFVKKDGTLWMCGINNQESLDKRYM